MKSRRVIRLGDKGVYERTNPDYVDEKIARLLKDYDECPKAWRKTFLAGLDAKDLKALQERRKL